jgi:exodeoxyribonuclease V beta subunit
LSDLEIAGDQLRLLYVALTRAQHRLELWWANTWRAGSSALGAMLLDRVGAEPNRNTPAYSRKNDAKHLLDATAQIESLVEASDGALGLVRLPAQTTPNVWSGGGVVDERLLEVASVGARAPLADPAWRTWSFTAVSTVAGDAHRPAEVPVAGGLDEPADEAFTSLVDEVAPAYAPPGPPASEPMPLDDVRGGAAFGTLVHAVLEHVDFAASNLDHELRMACDREQQRSGVDVDPAVVAAGLRLSVDTPLGHSFGDRRLREFAASDRLTEVSFDLPLQRVDAADIGRVLAGHLDADDPVRTFAVRLSAELSDVGLAGWMTGSIDALLRVREPSGGTRFVVVDYKTNRLHPLGAPDPRSWYGRNEMHAAMVQHRYPLQALLYLVAVHRFLGVRLGSAYDPDRHLGGAAYLFVRGMVGAGTPADAGARHGVYHWHPPSAAIVAVDDLLAGRR